MPGLHGETILTASARVRGALTVVGPASPLERCWSQLDGDGYVAGYGRLERIAELINAGIAAVV